MEVRAGDWAEYFMMQVKQKWNCGYLKQAMHTFAPKTYGNKEPKHADTSYIKNKDAEWAQQDQRVVWDKECIRHSCVSYKNKTPNIRSWGAASEWQQKKIYNNKHSAHGRQAVIRYRRRRVNRRHIEKKTTQYSPCGDEEN